MGSVGKWRDHLYLVGGLVPRYLVEQPDSPVERHIGSTDVDIAIIIAVDDANAYETLERELKNLGFQQAPGPDGSDFQWGHTVDGVAVIVEFICETDNVEPGRSAKVRGKTGSGFQAFNVKGISLIELDYVERTIEASRFDTNGLSAVDVRIPNVLPWVVLKITAFQDRHHNKDAYDVIWLLLNHPGGPVGAAADAKQSPAIDQELTTSGLGLLAARFANEALDGPRAYAEFLGQGLDAEAVARLANEAVAAVDAFVAALDG